MHYLLPATRRAPKATEPEWNFREQLDQFRTMPTGKELVIFDRRLVAEEPITLQELGDEFGVSRERVRQLESRLTGKLRVYLAERLGDAVQVAD